jgi:uncharacterized protein
VSEPLSPLPGRVPWPGRVRWPAVVAFVVLAVVLAWAVASPLWISGDGLASPLAPVLLPVMMFTPAVSAIVVVLGIVRPPRGSRLRALSLLPVRPWRRTLLYGLLGWLGPIALLVLGVAVSAALGLVRLDLVHFSGFAESFRSATHGAPLKLPIEQLAVLELAQLPVAGLVNMLFTIGEELGWRGFLLPALRPLGTWPSLLITGVVWGLWHAPVILLGYDFGRPGLDGLGLMVVGTTVFGILIGWLRLRSGSVWPSVVAHGSLNAMGGLLVVVAASGGTGDPAITGPLGAVLWVLEAIVILVLVATGRMRWRPDAAQPASGATRQIT